jgi:hypothetical protein
LEWQNEPPILRFVRRKNNQYDEAALREVEIFMKGEANSLEIAWAQETTLIFGTNTPSQKKGVPEVLFLDCVKMA